MKGALGANIWGSPPKDLTLCVLLLPASPPPPTCLLLFITDIKLICMAGSGSRVCFETNKETNKKNPTKQLCKAEKSLVGIWKAIDLRVTIFCCSALFKELLPPSDYTSVVKCLGGARTLSSTSLVRISRTNKPRFCGERRQYRNAGG